MRGESVDVPLTCLTENVFVLAIADDERALPLKSSIDAALVKASDKETRAHLEGARDQIAKILDPRFASTQLGGGAALRIFGDQWSGQPSYLLSNDPNDLAEGSQFANAPWQQMQNCWPDYTIRP